MLLDLTTEGGDPFELNELPCKGTIPIIRVGRVAESFQLLAGFSDEGAGLGQRSGSLAYIIPVFLLVG